jgi:hypothetical protein
MEWRRRLADLPTVPARHPLAHMLDDLPLARDHLQRLSDRLAELAQARAATAAANGWCGNDDALARQVLGERLAGWAFARERRDGRRLGGGLLGCGLILGGGCLRLDQLQLHLLDEARSALRRGAVDLPLERKRCSLLSITHNSHKLRSRTGAAIVESAESVVVPCRARDSQWRVLDGREKPCVGDEPAPIGRSSKRVRRRRLGRSGDRRRHLQG